MIKVVFIIAFIALANAEYHHKFEPAPLGPHGEVIDTPEVEYQKKFLEKAHHEAIDKLHQAGGYEHDEDKKHYKLRTADDNPGNFYNIYGKYDLVDGKYIPKTKEVYIAAVDHLKAVDEIKDKLYH